MALLSKLKQLLGVDGSASHDRGTAVTVENEPDAASERAVKEPVADHGDASGAGPTVDEAEPAGSDEPVDTLSGIGPAYAERLGEAGVETVGELASADAAELDAATGIGEGRLSGWIERAKDR